MAMHPYTSKNSYTATRLTHLLSMLNNDDNTVRELARASLMLDLKKRKVPLAKAGQDSFLGFGRKSSGETGHKLQALEFGRTGRT